MADGHRPEERVSSRPVEARDRWKTGIRYSICTLVTRPDQYAKMVSSFRRMGFGGDDCEFIQVDNSQGNRCDAFEGCNLMLSVARGDFIIICHQDVLLLEDDRRKLDGLLAHLDETDPMWAVCGNAGGVWPGKWSVRITDPYGADQRAGELPNRVWSLDENFLLVRRSANLALSSDLTGFHMYGTDICIIADMLGRSAYVIDFHLRHLSAGNRDASLERARSALAAKYMDRLRSRWIATPCAIVFLSGSSFMARILNTRAVARFVYSVTRAQPGLAGLVFGRRR